MWVEYRSHTVGASALKEKPSLKVAKHGAGRSSPCNHFHPVRMVLQIVSVYCDIMHKYDVFRGIGIAPTHITRVGRRPNGQGTPSVVSAGYCYGDVLDGDPTELEIPSLALN